MPLAYVSGIQVESTEPCTPPGRLSHTVHEGHFYGEENLTGSESIMKTQATGLSRFRTAVQKVRTRAADLVCMFPSLTPVFYLHLYCAQRMV